MYVCMCVYMYVCTIYIHVCVYELHTCTSTDPNYEHKKTPSRDRIETIKCTEDA